MRVYRVSPILKYSPFYRLTYFSRLDFSVGNICEIDFNKKKIQAVIVEVLEMNDAKVEIRSGNFKTKKIEVKLEEDIENFFTPKQFSEIQNFADKFLLSIGEVIYAIFGDRVQGVVDRVKKGKKSVGKYEEIKSIEVGPDRIGQKSGRVSGKQIFETLENLRKQNKLENLQEIIINDFDLEKYIQYQVPHISQIHLLTLYLKIFCTSPYPEGGGLGCGPVLKFKSVFFGISENIFLEKIEKSQGDGLRIKIEQGSTLLSSPCQKFIYNKQNKKFDDVENVSNQEKILDDEILKIIRKESADESTKNLKTFIFVLSHGYQSSIYCRDCKGGYACEKCEHNFSILSEVEEGVTGEESSKRYLYCKNCQNKKPLKDDQYLICKKCGSWGLFPYGEGAQKVYEELGGGPTIAFIDESQKKLSDKKMRETVEDFLNNNGKKILLGTKRVLKVLQNLMKNNDENHHKIQTIVVSMGGMSTGKSFDSDEKFMKLLSELESVSVKMYVGKNKQDENVLEKFKDKEKFLKEEAEFRKEFNLPPFTNVLTLSCDKRLRSAANTFFKTNLIEGTPLLGRGVGERVKGSKIIYHFLLNDTEIQNNKYLLESLRQFGELVVSHVIYENYIQKR